MLKGCSWKAHAASWVTEVSVTRRSSAGLHWLTCPCPVDVWTCIFSRYCREPVPFSKSSVLVSQRGVPLSPAQCCAWHIQSLKSNKKAHTDRRNSALHLLWVWSLMAHGLLTWPRDLPLEYSGGHLRLGWGKVYLEIELYSSLNPTSCYVRGPSRESDLPEARGKWIVNTGSESLEQYLFGPDFTGCKTC